MEIKGDALEAKTAAGVSGDGTVTPGTGTPGTVIPKEIAAELRRVSHDLSNSLEVIVQTSYLLSLAELKEPAAEWLRMLDGGVSKALEQNESMRGLLRRYSPK